MWRWRFRGGAAATAFTALWGGVFDFLAAEHPDRRSARPDAAHFSAGDAIRWRRGRAANVVVPIRMTGEGRTDTLTLLFDSLAVVTTPPMPEGSYMVEAPGGTSRLVVNRSGEWLPRPPVAIDIATLGVAPRRRDPLGRSGWPYVAAVLLLCTEWIVRRAQGLR
jgi:hypothetical protein